MKDNDAGLADVVTVLEGDALTTLASLEGPVDYVRHPANGSVNFLARDSDSMEISCRV